MKRYLAFSLWGVAASVAFGQNAPPASAQDRLVVGEQTISTNSAEIAVKEFQAQMRVMEMKLAEAQSELQRQEELVKAGMATASSLAGLQVKLAEAKAKLGKAKHDLELASRLHALSQHINITLDNVRIEQVANLLSKMSPISITVDRTVPVNLTLTTKAKDVALGTALEMIASSANLAITLRPDGGLTFVPPGKISINGKIVDYKGPAWPWSDDMVFTMEPSYGPLGERWRKLADVPLMLESYAGSSPLLGPWVQAGPGPLAVQPMVTALGSNMLVVAEPGRDAKGQAGLWLTLYTVRNGQIKLSSRYFHKGRPDSAPAVRSAVSKERLLLEERARKAGKAGKAGKTGKNGKS